MQLSDVLAARQRIAPYIRRTPIVDSDWLSDLAGASVRLKLESLQVTNSFKARGAVNAAAARLERLGDHDPGARSLVTASAGESWPGARLRRRTDGAAARRVHPA